MEAQSIRQTLTNILSRMEEITEMIAGFVLDSVGKDTLEYFWNTNLMPGRKRFT